jgi:hypothetical protein
MIAASVNPGFLFNTRTPKPMSRRRAYYVEIIVLGKSKLASGWTVSCSLHCQEGYDIIRNLRGCYLPKWCGLSSAGPGRARTECEDLVWRASLRKDAGNERTSKGYSGPENVIQGTIEGEPQTDVVQPCTAPDGRNDRSWWPKSTGVRRTVA